MADGTVVKSKMSC